MQCVHNDYINILSAIFMLVLPYKCSLQQYYGIPMGLGAPLATPGFAGIQILLSLPCQVRIDSDLVGNIYMYESFDLNLLMAHCAIFLKLYNLVFHQKIYDNWHTATFIFCQSAESFEI